VLVVQISHSSSDDICTSWVLVPVSVRSAAGDVEMGKYPSRRIRIGWQMGKEQSQMLGGKPSAVSVRLNFINLPAGSCTISTIC
jgi:hypothetical protein